MELIVPQTALQDDEAVQGRQPLTIEEVAPSILIYNEDYIVINKPPAVRMDGNFPVTIDKIVASWIGTGVKSLKWTHQLDFATSGALCIALNREAAAAVVSAFEHRSVRKNYIAALQGHVDFNAWAIRESNDESISDENIEDTVLDEYRTELIATNKKAKRKLAEVELEKKNIVLWQASVMEQNLNACLTAFTSYTPSSSLSEQLINEYNLLKSIPEDKYRRAAKCRKQLRRFLQKVGIEVDIIDSNEENAAVKLPGHIKPKLLTSVVSNDANNGPFPLTIAELETVCAGYRSPERGAIFRLPPSLTSSSSHRLIIDIPVAELDGDFRMEPGHDRNPGRRAVTELQILEYGLYQGQPVTKVLFKPISGRRHQLRIHALCLGHPIVGDFTYNQFHRQVALSTSSSEGSVLTAERMMLHAHVLTVPFPNFGKCSLPFKRKWLFKEMKEKSKTDNEQLSDEELWQKIMSYDSTILRTTEITMPLVDVIADDPFLFDIGELKPILPVYMQSKTIIQ